MNLYTLHAAAAARRSAARGPPGREEPFIVNMFINGMPSGQLQGPVTRHPPGVRGYSSYRYPRSRLRLRRSLGRFGIWVL